MTVFLLPFFLNDCEEESLEPELEDLELAYQPKEIQEFLDSEDFKKNEFFFAGYGRIAIGKVGKFKIFGDSACQLMIPLLKYFNKDTTAYLQVIKLPENELPDRGVYFMNLLCLLEGFDNSTVTGKVSMLGVNYKTTSKGEPFEHCRLEVRNNRIIFSEYFPLPEEYLQQVASKFKFRDFLSCYRTTREYMNSDDLVYFLCDIVGGACAVTASAYCIYTLSNDGKGDITALAPCPCQQLSKQQKN